MSPSSFAQTVLFLLIDRKCPVFFFLVFFVCLFVWGGWAFSQLIVYLLITYLFTLAPCEWP